MAIILVMKYFIKSSKFIQRYLFLYRKKPQIYANKPLQNKFLMFAIMVYILIM